MRCGQSFVRGARPGHKTGFDMDDADLNDMEQCRGIIVASTIFGNFDLLRQPKNISEAAQKNVCFFMFLDEETEEYMRNKYQYSGWKQEAEANKAAAKYDNASIDFQIDFYRKEGLTPYSTASCIDMFLDCERHNFVVQGYHRDVLEHMAPPVEVDRHLPPSPPPPPPPVVGSLQEKTSNKRLPARRGRGRRRGNRKVAAGSTENK
ncbi:hypothetical protein Dimus_032745 [Dionaea muscipula]